MLPPPGKVFVEGALEFSYLSRKIFPVMECVVAGMHAHFKVALT
jgi:hypothetical protein